MNSLKNISDVDLERNLKGLVAQERKLLHVILLHVKEIDTRKIYLQRAYSSLYEYMTQELGYSGSAAMRRIEAARLLADVPDLASKIQEGSVNLSQIGEMARAIKEKEKTDAVTIEMKSNLLCKIANTSAQTTQKILAQELSIEVKEYDRQRIQKDESVRLEMTLSKEQFEKLTACKDLLGHILLKEQSGTGWSDVIEMLTDQVLKQKKLSSSTIGTVLRSVTSLKSVTPKLRREVIKRDGCCQFRDPLTGKVCGSKFAPQTDHRQSQWAGGEHSLTNLQVLCGQHNRLKYSRESSVKILR